MDIKTGMDLPVGTEITISGLRFDPSLPDGFEFGCAPGRESLLRVSHSYHGGMTVNPPPRRSLKPMPRDNTPKGPPRRKRW